MDYTILSIILKQATWSERGKLYVCMSHKHVFSGKGDVSTLRHGHIQEHCNDQMSASDWNDSKTLL